MAECFISYSTGNRSFVEGELAGLLRALAIEPWYASDDIRTAEVWDNSIQAALESCHWFVLVMSPDSARSEYVKHEIAWAMKNRWGRIVPIILGDCRPEDFHIGLPRVQLIDFLSDQQKAREQLIRMFVDAEYRSMRRAGAIVGSWKGTVYQDKGGFYPEGTEYPVHGSFDVIENTIRGNICAELPVDDRLVGLECLVRGSTVYERFIQLNYSSTDKAAIQFGSILLELSSGGQVARGKFVGYGAMSEDIISGDVTMTKLA